MSYDSLRAEVPPFEGTWGKGANGIIWYYDTLSAGMAAYPVELRERIAAVADEFANTAEEYLKANAPWEDRTGDARAGLKAEAIHELLLEQIVLYHTVSYGVWLEIRFSGIYAIIVPSLEVLGAEFMTALELAKRL
jgi:hypothetical protein